MRILTSMLVVMAELYAVQRQIITPAAGSDEVLTFEPGDLLDPADTQMSKKVVKSLLDSGALTPANDEDDESTDVARSDERLNTPDTEEQAPNGS